MDHRIRIAATALAAVAIVASGQSAAAGSQSYDEPAPGYHDADRRHCISENEIKAWQQASRVRTRTVWEGRWEVQGLGFRSHLAASPNPNIYVLGYKSCGYHLDQQIAFLFYRRSSQTLLAIFLYYPQGEFPINSGPTRVAIRQR